MWWSSYTTCLDVTYVEGRMHAGDTKTEALRLLRRRLSNEVLRRMLADFAAISPDVLGVAA